MQMRPAAPNAQQVNSFESQQQLQAQRDTEARQHQQELAAALQQLQQTEGVPGPEAAGAPPMTAAQRDEIYGNNPMLHSTPQICRRRRPRPSKSNWPKKKQQQDAIDSDTLAIDFERTGPTPATTDAAQGRLLSQPAARLRPNQSLRRQRLMLKRTRWPDTTSIPTMAVSIASSRDGTGRCRDQPYRWRI